MIGIRRLVPCSSILERICNISPGWIRSSWTVIPTTECVIMTFWREYLIVSWLILAFILGLWPVECFEGSIIWAPRRLIRILVVLRLFSLTLVPSEWALTLLWKWILSCMVILVSSKWVAWLRLKFELLFIRFSYLVLVPCEGILSYRHLVLFLVPILARWRSSSWKRISASCWVSFVSRRTLFLRWLPLLVEWIISILCSFSKWIAPGLATFHFVRMFFLLWTHSLIKRINTSVCKFIRESALFLLFWLI